MAGPSDAVVPVSAGLAALAGGPIAEVLQGFKEGGG
jgi:hypothetical protein